MTLGRPRLFGLALGALTGYLLVNATVLAQPATCYLAVNGTSVDAYADPGKALVVKPDATVHVTGAVPDRSAAYGVDVALAGVSVQIAGGTTDRGNYALTVNVADYSKFTGGTYEIRVYSTGPTACAHTFYARIDQSPLATPVGIAAIAVLVVGLIGVLASAVPRGRHPFAGAIAGGLAALGGVVVAQQSGIVYPSLPVFGGVVAVAIASGAALGWLGGGPKTVPGVTGTPKQPGFPYQVTDQQIPNQQIPTVPTTTGVPPEELITTTVPGGGIPGMGTPEFVPVGQTVPDEIRRQRRSRGCNFSDGSWRPAGSAFGDPWVRGRTLRAERARLWARGRRQLVPPARLGGDYWYETDFDLGPIDEYLISDDRSQGTYTSAGISLDSPYITFLIAGGSDQRPQSVRAELWVEEPGLSVPSLIPVDPGTVEATGRGGWVPQEPGPLGDIGGVPAELSPDGLIYQRRLVAIAPGADVLERVNWDVTPWSGRLAHVRLVDESTGRHIIVSDIRCAAEPGRQPRPAAVWGFADLHTHPMNHFAHGGRVVHGSYPAHSQSPWDIGTCEPSHTGRGFDVPGLVLDHLFNDYAHRDGVHRGPRQFDAWPNFADGIHTQMHPEWVRRAFDGGLRLLVALAVNSEYMSHRMGDRQLHDMEAIETQLRFWTQVCSHNSEWMEIARSPMEARRIVGEGKLAVVLGIEVDRAVGMYATVEQLETVVRARFPALGVTPNTVAETIRVDLRHLWSLGARQINPIHLTDNAFGGMALYEETFNMQNAWISASPERPNGNYHQIHATTPADAIDFRYGDGDEIQVWIERRDLAWSGALAGAGAVTGAVFPVAGAAVLLLHAASQVVFWTKWPAPGRYNPPDYGRDTNGNPIPPGAGHKNALALTFHGSVGVREMMRAGWMVDVDHMSAGATTMTLRQAATYFDGTVVRRYPLVSSHASMRALSPRRRWEDRDDPIAPGQRRNWHAWPSETEKSAEVLDALRELGSIVAPITSHLISLAHGPVENTCAASSRTWAQEFAYAVDRMGGQRVGIGTDMGLTHQIAPRFGTFAAFGLYDEAEAPHFVAGVFPAGAVGRARIEGAAQIAAQRNGVRYTRVPVVPPGIWSANNSPFQSDMERDAWEAIGMLRTGRTPSGTSRAENYARGFRAATESVALTAGGDAVVAFRARRGDALEGEQAGVGRVWQLSRGIDGANAPLEPCSFSVAGEAISREWDFNAEGLAHYGLMPDFMQDLRNVGLTQPYMSTLFRSAEDYISVWEQCWRVRAVEHRDAAEEIAAAERAAR